MNFPDIYTQIQEVAAGYNYKRPPDFIYLVQAMIERFLRFASDLLDMLHVHVPGLTDSRMVSNVMQSLLILLGVVCLIIVVIFLTRQIRIQNLSKAKTKIIGASANVLLTAKDWQEESERLANSGQFREACRALYFSFLRVLDEREILQFSPTRTNYEYLYALAKKKQLAAIFKKLVGLVEAAWFGNYSPDRSDYEQCQQLVSQAIQLPDAQKREVAP